MITADDYKNPYGIWKVTTEGDCEGRTTYHLGTYQGYVDEIAFALADSCCYSLRFEKICLDIPVPKVAKDKVNISFDINSKTWNMDKTDRVRYFQRILSERKNVFVSECMFTASVTLSRKNLEDAKRRIALAKLTEEERRLLGLN